MSAGAIAASSFATSVKRYTRSRGLWLLLLVAPVGARFMIARDNGSGFDIAVGRHLPVMTSAVLGVSLGIVVSTLLLPIGFLYLRSNTTRRQPWQVEEVTAPSRVPIMFGRFAADVAMLFATLTALTLAGWFLALFMVSGPIDLGQITLALWLVAAPALVGLAAVHILFAALPFARRGIGELLYFVLWMATLVAPIAIVDRPAGFGVDMIDFAGFVRPLVAGSPLGEHDIAIGGTKILPGRVPLDVMTGLLSPGYIPSRLTWAAIAFAVAALAGLLYRPHRASRRSREAGRLERLMSAGPPSPADAAAPPASAAALPVVGLIMAEFRLIGVGRLFTILAVVAAMVGVIGDYRHVGSPAALSC